MNEESRSASVFLDTNVLAAYIFKEQNRFEIARRYIKSFAIRGISIIAIHELYTIAMRRGVGGRFFEVKRLIEKAFKIHPLSQRGMC